MSFDPVLWAMKDAPVANVEEWAILACLAEHADDDGCNAMPSQANIAKRTKVSVATVKRRITELAARGIIRRGDQALAERYTADRRPVVWDLMIPYSWFPNLERIQEYRAERGRTPLRQQDRPKLPPAPEKPRRVDLGQSRDGGPSSTVALSEPSHSVSDGSASAERGVLKSVTGAQAELQPSPLTLPMDPPLLVVVADAPTETKPKAAPRKSTGASDAQGHRLPADFEVTPEMQDWARVEAPLIGWPEHKRFMDHWAAQPGIKGRKTNWEATWRNWMRKAQSDAELLERRAGRRVSGSPRPTRGPDVPETW